MTEVYCIENIVQQTIRFQLRYWPDITSNVRQNSGFSRMSKNGIRYIPS